jgi:glycolate oxidase FAD binding subunit
MNTGAATSLAEKLSQRFTAAPSSGDPGALASYEVDCVRPAAIVQPADASEVGEFLRFAAAEKLAVIPCGGRTKLGIGAPPARYDVALDLSRMNRILAYDPRDLTLGVEAGVGYRALSEVLAAERQFLPLAPPFADRATLGGILAADSTSPLRQAYGGPRDFVLGMEFVTGSGAQSKSGGRVVKNVTGYDLHKALIGSLGTLAVITRVNFKTFPVPPIRAIFVAEFADCAAAHAFSMEIAKSPLGPQMIEEVSPEAARLLSSLPEQGTGLASNLSKALDERVCSPFTERWSVVIVAAGHESVVERHARELRSLADRSKAVQFARDEADTEEPNQSALIAALCEFPRIAQQSSAAATIFRIAAIPTAMPALVESIRALAQRSEIPHATIARSSGLIYAALLPTSDDGATVEHLARASDEIFRVAAELGARARIESAPLALKRRVSVWGPPHEDFELMSRVKKVFDAAGVLSPGRFVGGI